MLASPEAVIAQPPLQIDATVHSGTLILLTMPGVVVDADDVAVRGSSVKVREPWGPEAPVTLRIKVSGEVDSGSITARPPRRSFFQWLLRRPRPYALACVQRMRKEGWHGSTRLRVDQHRVGTQPGLAK